MSKSGIDTRSGLRKRSNSRPSCDRIEIGDGQRPGDDRAGARAAARADRNAVLLRPFDEVGDDQEIAGESPSGDDVDLEFEPVAIGPCVLVGEVLFGEPRRASPARASRAQLLASLAIAGEARQDRLALGAADRAAPGDDRVFAIASGRSANSVGHRRAGFIQASGEDAARSSLSI